MSAKKKILLVDDEKSFTSLLKLNLEDTGDYEVHVENWAEDAYPAAQRFKPDLVLLDIIMPRMPGGDVAAQIDAPELDERRRQRRIELSSSMRGIDLIRGRL